MGGGKGVRKKPGRAVLDGLKGTCPLQGGEKISSASHYGPNISRKGGRDFFEINAGREEADTHQGKGGGRGLR